MTKTAVDYQGILADKEAKRVANEINLKKANISEAELAEAIRHNKVDELLAERKVNQSLAKTILDGIGSAGSAARGVGSILAAVNDESYHNKLTIAYDQATNLPFNERAGNPAQILRAGSSLPGTVASASLYKVKALPAFNSGIIHVRYVPTIGTIKQQVESSELQNNVRLLWTPVRQSNSGAVNSYDQSDLFQMTLASSSVFEMLRLISRPLNYLNAKRKAMNTITAWDKTLLSVMCGGLANAEYIIENQTDITQAINSCIRSFNSQALPIGFDLTKRRSLLNGRIFTFDGDRDELYIFSPSVYYVYDEATATLVARSLDLNYLFASISNMRDVITRMLNPLVNGTVTSIMAGDMKKAFPKQVSIIRELPLKYNGDVYSKDEHILEALRNATVIPFVIDVNDTLFHQNFDIKQGVNANQDTYIYQGRLNVNKEAYLTADTIPAMSNFTGWLASVENSAGSMIGTIEENKILDVKKDVPERYDIMAGTRFMTTELQVRGYENSTYTQVCEVYQWGSEIINDVQVYGFRDKNDYQVNDLVTNGYIVITGNYFGFCSEYQENMRRVYERFHYLPQWYNTYGKDYRASRIIDEFGLTHYIHSLYNYRIMSDDELGHLHVASFGSLVSITSQVDNNLEK